MFLQRQSDLHRMVVFMSKSALESLIYLILQIRIIKRLTHKVSAAVTKTGYNKYYLHAILNLIKKYKLECLKGINLFWISNKFFDAKTP